MVCGRLPASPSSTARSVQWPLPVSASEPYSCAPTRRVFSSRPRRTRSSANVQAAFIGPMVWELDGPTPILKISRTLRFMRAGRLLHRKQRGVATDGRRIDRQRPLVGKAMQVVRSARLGTRPGQAAAAEGLHTDDRTDDIAVDVDVAGAHPRRDPAGAAVDPRVDAKGETVA